MPGEVTGGQVALKQTVSRVADASGAENQRSHGETYVECSEEYYDSLYAGLPPVGVMSERWKRAMFEEPTQTPISEEEIEINWLGFTAWIHSYWELPSVFRMMLTIYLFAPGVTASAESDMVIALAQAKLLEAQATVTYGYLLMCFCMMFLMYLCWMSFSKWVTKEVRDVKFRLTVYGILSLLIPVLTKFGSKWWFSNWLRPQGARQDANRAGMFLTGLLSICLFLLAPFMGAKKIVNLIKPVLDMLKQIPYASWMCDWLSKWWNGDVDFDDLPQNTRECDEYMQDADLQDLQNELRKTRKEMKTQTGDVGPDIKRATDELKSQYTRSDSPCKRDPTEILEELLEQVEEDTERGTQGLRASDEELPKENNIPFDYTKQRFIRAKDAVKEFKQAVKDVRDTLAPDEVFDTSIGKICYCNKCKGKKAHNEVGKTTDTCSLPKEYNDDYGSYWRSVEQVKDDAKKLENEQEEIFPQGEGMKAWYCSFFGINPNNNSQETKDKYTAAAKQKAEAMDAEVPSYDEANEKWWDEFWDSGPTWDSLWEKGEKCRNYISEESKRCWTNYKKPIIGISLILLLAAGAYYCKRQEDVYEAEQQARGKNKQRAGGVRVRRGGKRFDPSGGKEQELEQDEFEFDDRVGYDHYEFEPVYEGDMNVGFRGRKLRGQSFEKQPVSMPTLRDDSKIKRVIYDSKKRVYRADAKIIDAFLLESRRRLEGELSKLKKQGWNPNDKSAGIFKIRDHLGRYRCTGTLVGGRMFVVNHVIDESLTGQYHAWNHIHSIPLDLSKYQLVNDEIGWFPVNGIPSPFKNRDFKVLEVASIVTIFGFGGGEGTTPDCIQGFASPLGWCNAQTRAGDCSSPALDIEGKILGFWTHGNGQTFGRFEPITHEWAEMMKEDPHNPIHTGLDFRSRPLFPKNL